LRIYCPSHAADRQRESYRAKCRARRALKRGLPTEPYTFAEIAERDRRTCQICCRRVAMTKVAPHPKAPTIDHVIPISDGGPDTRANVQLAHFWCNSHKGTRGTQQLALVG
jgi:5-methylcytosine-specific restriction endonuclease McrA